MSASAPDPRRAYAIVAVASLSYTTLMFVWFALPAYLSPIIEELALSSTQAGIVVGAVPLTYIPLALFTGVFVDRAGPGRSLGLGVAIFGVAQIGRSWATGFPSLLGFTLLLGVGATAITFGLPKLVSVLFPPDRTGLPSAIYLVAANAGSAAAFAIGRPVLGPRLGGWRALFFWSGLFALGYAVCWFAISWTTDVDGSVDGSGAPNTVASVLEDLRAVLAHRQLQLLVAIGTMYLLVVHGTQGWLPTVLETRGMAAGPAGVTTSGFVVSLVVGIVVVPAIAERVGRRRWAIVGCGGCVALGIGGIVAGAAGSTLVATVFLAGLGAGGVSPLLRAIPPALDGIGSRLTGTAVGFVFAVGEVGGFLGPVVIGSLHAATGSFAPGFAVLAGAGIGIVWFGAILARSGQRPT